MKDARLIMGMPVVIDIPGADVSVLEHLFEFFSAIDERFSTYKKESEISQINDGTLEPEKSSPQMREVFAKAEQTRAATAGFFDIRTPDGSLDPSGIVKGWGINGAADLARSLGYQNYWIEAGGDIQTNGVNERGEEWSVGIRNPFNGDEIVKVICPHGSGVATSGTYIRGAHIYDPKTKQPVETPLVSLTVVGPNVYDADRFATAAFAMGPRGILFLEQLPGLEAYAISEGGIATSTSGFDRYVV